MVRSAVLIALVSLCLGADVSAGGRRRYFLLRHGRSLANEAAVISSDPELATREHGLSELGRQQAADAGREVVMRARERVEDGSEGGSDGGSEGGSASRATRVAIFSSDFVRAKETADAVHAACVENAVAVWPTEGPCVDVALRERWFGEWDGGSDTNYERVWIDDAHDPSHTRHGVESVESVVNRTGDLLDRIESALEAQLEGEEVMVVVVAHGDVLQILQAAHAEQIDPRLHRSLEHLPTATLRRVVIRR